MENEKDMEQAPEQDLENAPEQDLVTIPEQDLSKDNELSAEATAVPDIQDSDALPKEAFTPKLVAVPITENKTGPASPQKKKSKLPIFLTGTISIVIFGFLALLFLVAILVGAVIFFWNDADPGSNPPIENSEALSSEGNTVGALCYGADLPLITPEGIQSETADPSKTGKITIINFWGTWCTPRLNDLPYFDQIATDYKDSVSVFAVHTNMINETAPDYIASHYPESDLVFASDLADEGYYSALGGRGSYPYTLVLDEKGIITHIFVNAPEYEDLKEAVEENLS